MTEPGLVPFEPRVAAASLSGESDAEWARTAAPYVGAAILGGVAVDDQTRQAARELAEQGRTEFLPTDPIDFIESQLADLVTTPVVPGVNVRASTLDSLQSAAQVCAESDAICEINAHCRQAEMTSIGAGQSLLAEPDRLSEHVRAAAETGATVSVKVRTEVPGVALPQVAQRIERAGSDVIHVDAMDSEGVVAEVVAATELFVIANNGVRDRSTVREYLAYGADAVSVGRPSDRPAVLDAVRHETEEWFESRTEAPQ